jgi:hypothetical protein
MTVLRNLFKELAMVFWKRSTPKKETIPQQPVRPSVAPTAAPVAERKPADKSRLAILDDKDPEAPPSKNGFDPYNSGAFDRRDTWGKVIRK